jgi:subtilisin family serine protease
MKNNTIMHFLFIGLLLASSALYSQHTGVSTTDSLDKKHLNWYNLSPVDAKDQGASVNKSYTDLLKNKTSGKKIIVAVIDGGVDITHPELQGKIWVNSDEIAGNGIDDDNNGFVDDINGWNFIGNSKGENILFENMEYVRILRTLNPKFEKVVSINEVKASDQESYKLYLKCKTKYFEELEKYTKRKKNLDEFGERLRAKEDIIKDFLGRNQFDQKDIESIASVMPEVNEAKAYFLNLFKQGFTFKSFVSMKERTNNFLDYYLNLKFDARKLVGDNPDDITDNKYGNNDVNGPRAFHGTFVSGIIAAKRNNGIGIDGIADNV